VGVPRLVFGEGVTITEDKIPRITKSPDTLKAAKAAGIELGRRLREGHDRKAVAGRMQSLLMAKLREST
jgi:hypothetical protein